jgi:hypothetical protein
MLRAEASKFVKFEGNAQAARTGRCGESNSLTIPQNVREH